MALNPVGYVLIGPISGHVGVGATLTAVGVVNLASSFVMLAVPSVRSIRSDDA